MYVERGERESRIEVELDPQDSYEEERPHPTKEVKIVVLKKGRSVRIRCKLKPGLEQRIVQCLKDNM